MKIYLQLVTYPAL